LSHKRDGSGPAAVDEIKFVDNLKAFLSRGPRAKLEYLQGMEQAVP